MKITIINQHTNNFGDEAAGISLINNLFNKFENLDIYLIYNGDGTINYDRENLHHLVDCKLKYMGYFNIFMKLIFHKYKGNKTMQMFDKQIQESDYVFVAPCGANIGIYKDWRFLVRILFAIFNGKTPIFHLNTIGKSGNYLFDRMALYALKRSKVYVREKKSLEYMKSKNIDAQLGIDTAFLFDVKDKINIEEKRFTFVASDVSKHKNFKNIDTKKMMTEKIIPTIAKFVKDNNFTLHILPHLNTEEELVFLNEIITELKEKYGLTNIIKDDIKTVFDYYEMIAKSKIVIGMRYHAIVLAAKANTPFVGLAYENKMVEASDYTEKTEQCIKLYNDFEKEQVMERLNYALKNYDIIRNELKEVNEKIKPLAELPIGEIKC